MQFYLDGQEITGSTAYGILTACAELIGHSTEEWAPAWDTKEDSEESREMLNELSGYRLEFVAA